jgi:hypothetical protein
LEEPFSIDWLKLSVPPEGVGDKFATTISGFDVDWATDRELELAQKEDISLTYSSVFGMTPHTAIKKV